MSLLRIDTTIRGAQSASSALADLVEAEWTAAHPDAPVVRRHLGTDPLPATAWADAVTAGWTAPEDRTEAQNAAVALATELAEELVAAEAVIMAMPLYNFGVSQHTKVWIDLVIAAPRSPDSNGPLLAGKPVVLVTSRGGGYGPGTPREGWDHNTDYLRRILADVWGADLTVVEREFTLVGVNPALDQFTEIAAQMKKGADDDARRAGTDLAARKAA
ncbi:MAG: NAD(P)H-dependent oxidoreductase [Kineosporiaceae bacterium]